MFRDEGAADAASARARLSQADANFGGGLKAHILAALFAAGATLALLTLALPHSPRVDAAGVWAIAGIAYVVAALLFWRADAGRLGLLALALGGGTTLIMGVAYFSAEDPSPLIFLYLWVYLYSAYFFTTRMMLAQIAYVARHLRDPADGALADGRRGGVVAGRDGHAGGRRGGHPRDARARRRADRAAV